MSRSTRVPSAGRLLPPLVVAGVAAMVFRGALDYFFSQDDFAALARAAGLIPRFAEPWRWLALQAYFDVMRPLAGLAALPYHAVSLTAHAACSALLYLLLRRATAGPPALIGALFFASHPALFTAVYWISTTGDVLAVLIALTALATALRCDPARWLALPLYAAALLCKESVLALPVALAACQVWRRRAPRPAPTTVPTASAPIAPGPRALLDATLDPLAIAMAALGTLYILYFIATQDLAPALGAAPYAAGPGGHVAANALSYLGWTANVFLPTVRGFTDAVDPRVFGWAVALIALWGAGCVARSLRDRGWIEAGVIYVAMLLPVLPLRNHTYHYYLYAALPAAAWALAALSDWALAPLLEVPAAAARAAAPPAAASPRRRRDAAATVPVARPARAAVAWGIAAMAGGLLALNGALLVRKIESAPLLLPQLRAEPLVDRARIARNVIGGLRARPPAAGTTLLLWSPEAMALVARARGDSVALAEETYWERNVRTALYDGLAIRLFFPAVREVRFVRAPVPAGDSALFALYDVDGKLRLFSPAALDSLGRAGARSGR